LKEKCHEWRHLAQFRRGQAQRLSSLAFRFLGIDELLSRPG
jgi:hypothetical protein